MNKQEVENIKQKALEDINLYAVWNELNIGDTYTLKGEYIG